MNWNIVEGNWKQFKGQIQSHWGKLTHDRPALMTGRRIRLIGLLQENYGMSQDEARDQVRRLEELHKDTASKPVA